MKIKLFDSDVECDDAAILLAAKMKWRKFIDDPTRQKGTVFKQEPFDMMANINVDYITAMQKAILDEMRALSGVSVDLSTGSPEEMANRRAMMWQVGGGYNKYNADYYIGVDTANLDKMKESSEQDFKERYLNVWSKANIH